MPKTISSAPEIVTLTLPLGKEVSAESWGDGVIPLFLLVRFAAASPFQLSTYHCDDILPLVDME